MENCELIKRRNYTVVKKNELIRFCRFSLTARQKKVLLYLISMIRPEDSPNTVYRTSLREICEIFGLEYRKNGRYYALLREDLRAIASVSFWVDVNQHEEETFRWIDSFLLNKVNTGVVFSFHHSVAPFLFNVKRNYTQYAFYNALVLENTYSISLYELLCFSLHKRELIIGVDDLRRHLSADDKGYQNFTNFRKKVLEPAVEEINEYTNLSVTLGFEKDGRTFSKAVLLIEEKSDFENIVTRHHADKRLWGRG